ncbi:hypothetical protein ACFFX1_16170 [Dactylosporangium sucinum]|uniref:Uncharacterized protein n=1 Tax=Dactylosporangium sucinum TaxID=1424081 RepID=A0A917TLS1_9ACTN|nr:hypothetical protein [Dactylosporangium sucinum]GGM27065.1 hypothetical protein GCM10007977_030350 [Dactylosporangium sucinum]
MVGYAVAGLATAPLAAAPMPSYLVPCEDITGDPAWLVWAFRETVWLSLAFSLPVAAVVAAVLAWRPGLSSKRAAAVGVCVGFALAAAIITNTIVSPTCWHDLNRVDP